MVGHRAPGYSRDQFWNGRLVVWQPARKSGYRFNLDPVLLSGFVGEGRHLLDLGAGCGILGLLLLGWNRVERVTAVELQPELAELAQRNARENGVSDRMQILCGDLRRLDLPTVDVVAFNPPYFPSGRGRAAPNRSRDLARHERYGTLADFVAVAARQLSGRGHLAAIVRAARAAELAELLGRSELAVTNVRPVSARIGATPSHSLVAARRDSLPRGAEPSPERYEPPLIVHREHGGRGFTDEVEALVRGPRALPWRRLASRPRFGGE